MFTERMEIKSLLMATVHNYICFFDRTLVTDKQSAISNDVAQLTITFTLRAVTPGQCQPTTAHDVEIE
jgi:hypothetical protein